LHQPANLTEQITRVIDLAWPCFIHYTNPADLLRQDTDAALKELLAVLGTVRPTQERAYDASVVPASGEITEDMARGHEHHPACLAMTVAVARCIPALAHALSEGTWDTPRDQHSARHALLAAHTRHHRLDPACGTPDTVVVEALAGHAERPVEISDEWRFMVRLTATVMGGEESAFEFMPMGCFTQLEQARNWSLVQAAWECLLLEDRELLTDPDHLAIVAEIERYDGTGDRVWRLPSTSVDIHLTARPQGQ
jgi:hypothetical protein